MGGAAIMTGFHEALTRAAILPPEEKPAEAVERLIRQIPPGQLDGYAFYVLGNTLFRDGRLEEAEAALRRAVRLDPGRAQAFNDLAATLFALGREHEAVNHIRRALALDPNLAEAQETDAIWLLRYGRFREGWKKYEARFRSADAAMVTRDIPAPRWQGEPLSGKRILLHAEQGLGDTIQFLRYVPLVAQLGGRVVLEVYEPVLPLLSGLRGVERVIIRGQPVPSVDTHCSLLSLPMIFRTDLDSIPANIPYLRAPAERLAIWRRRLGPRTDLRIGIVWSGNPRHREDKRRSMSFQQFSRLIRPDARASYHVIQAEVRDSDKADLAACANVRDHSALLKDFGDTAALLSLLDVVVGVDTSVMHLAGALGVPGCLMLMDVADWRWLLARDDSPWYPSLQLFRQPKRYDWESVLETVAERLQEMLA